MSSTTDEDRASRETRESEARINQMLADSDRLRQEQVKLQFEALKLVRESWQLRREDDAVRWRTIAAVAGGIAALFGVAFTAMVGLFKAFGVLH